MRNLFLILLIITIALLATAGWIHAEPTLSASISPAQFSVDTGGILTITINGSSSGDIHLPTLNGLRFQGRGQSSQVQIINGSLSSSRSSIYLVEAEHPGTYTIPPIAVSVDGLTLTTKPITFEVTQGGSSAPHQGSTSTSSTRLHSGETEKIAFLSISEVQQKSWTGEVFPIRIKAYFRQGIKANLNSLPTLKGDGFVMPHLDQKPPQMVETVNGTHYSVLTWDTHLSAVKEGTHTLTLELEAILDFPQRRNVFPGFPNQDLFEDDFFQNFFGGFDRKAVKITSEPIIIEARQLPTTGMPHDFSGAIGNFRLSVQAQPNAVEVGDPITLTMTISGKGNFDRVDAPLLSEDPKWKTYPPSIEFKQEDNATQGRKKFEQAMVVKDDSVTEIPAISFTFFDPTAEKYVTLTSPPIPLSVKHSSQRPAAVAPSAPASPAITTPTIESVHHGIPGLSPIYIKVGVLQKNIIPLFARTWFHVLLALCTILLLSVFLWKARLRHLRNNPNVRRKKEMKDLLVRNIKQINEAAAKNDSRQYLAACRKAIQELLGHHWQIEPSAITLADLQARLHQTSSLITIFATAEQSAYANHTLGAEQIRQYSDLLHKELSELL
jgi:hypothetical protein